MFDPTIIRSPLFLVFALSNFLLYFWYDVPYVFSVDQAKGLGISDRKASFLLSVIGIVNTFGQIIYGYIGDKNINLSLIYGLSISMAGLAIMFYTVFTSYTMMAVLCGTYGFFISANYVFSTLILVEYLGMDKLTNAYGLMMLIQGIANMLGPPFAGMMSKRSMYDKSLFDLHTLLNTYCLVAISSMYDKSLFDLHTLLNTYCLVAIRSMYDKSLFDLHTLLE
jgi:MFS family permease